MAERDNFFCDFLFPILPFDGNFFLQVNIDLILEKIGQSKRETRTEEEKEEPESILNLAVNGSTGIILLDVQSS